MKFIRDNIYRYADEDLEMYGICTGLLKDKEYSFDVVSITKGYWDLSYFTQYTDDHRCALIGTKEDYPEYYLWIH